MTRNLEGTMNLAEKYRPRTWEELVGLDGLQREIDAARRQGGLGGRAYWLAGRSGTGRGPISAELGQNRKTIQHGPEGRKRPLNDVL